MAPFLVAGEMGHRAKDAVLVVEFAHAIPSDKEVAIRMFQEECRVTRNLLGKENGHLDMIPNKRSCATISDAWVQQLPRPGKLRRTAAYSESTIITTG